MAAAGYLLAYFTVPSGITLCNATNSGGGPTAITVTAGSYNAVTFAAHVAAQLNLLRAPANWTVTVSTTTGLVTISTSNTPFAITWVSTDGRDVLGFAANFAGAATPQVGTLNARGLFIPQCPLMQDGDPKRAPEDTDLSISQSPNGGLSAIVGTARYVHRNLRYGHVARDRVWEGESSTKKSWEQWKRDTQLGRGHAWFSVLSGFHVVNHDGILLGQDLNAGAGPTGGWKANGPGWKGNEPRMTRPGYAGAWQIDIPMLVASTV